MNAHASSEPSLGERVQGGVFMPQCYRTDASQVHNGLYGSERVSKAALLGPIPPFLLKADDNPTGVPPEVFDGFKEAIRSDRPAFLTGFFDSFYNTDQLLGSRISADKIQSDFVIASRALAAGTLACVDTWLTDFRGDLPRFDIPTLIIQGDADRILPHESTGKLLPPLIANSELVVVPGGPHNIGWTHSDEVNEALLAFLAK